MYIVVLTYICYKINKLLLYTKGRFCLQKEALSMKGRYLLGLGSEIWSLKRRECLRKEDFVNERKVLFSYIALHLHIFVTK